MVNHMKTWRKNFGEVVDYPEYAKQLILSPFPKRCTHNKQKTNLFKNGVDRYFFDTDIIELLRFVRHSRMFTWS